MTLTGKAVLIVGATGGLGSAVAESIASQGVHLVLIHSRESGSASALKERLTTTGASFEFQATDFTRKAAIDDCIDRFFAGTDAPYGLINCLGSPARVDWKVAGIDELQQSFLLNAAAPLYSAKRFAAVLSEKKLGGAIVLFSSMQGIYPFENSLYYGAPKAALSHGVRILAKDFGPDIRINAIAPGVNQAGMAEESIKKGKYAKFVDQKIIPRYGEAANVASAVSFLMQPDLYMTGETLLFDGGMTLRRDLQK